MSPELDELVTGQGSVGRPLLTRLKRLVFRARARERRRRASPVARLGSLLVITLAALMATVGAINARGNDLRNDRNRSLADVVRAQASTNQQLQGELARLREEVARLSSQQADDPVLAAQLEQAEIAAGAVAVRGPAVKVVLTDAPLSVKPEGVPEDLLVVHQQDIQLVVNVLWEAGAEAMTIQGQRVISTTGVKCVGNSVVLHGVPYAPPYEIVAIGDPDALIAALDASPGIGIYKQYVEAYQLGWSQQKVGEVTMPAYEGGSSLTKASQPPR